MQVDRVDDTGIWGWLVDWGRSFEAYLPIGSIGKEKGRGERKAQAHFLTKAKRSLGSKSRQGMRLVAFVQHVEASSQNGVLSMNIEKPSFHLTVTRRGITDEIEKTTMDLSRDVQFCARFLVDKAAHKADVSHHWARQSTLHHAYEQALRVEIGQNEEEEDDDDDDQDEEDDDFVAKSPVELLINGIGSLEADDVEETISRLGCNVEEEQNVTAFASHLLAFCRAEKTRRSQPITISLTASIGGRKAMLQSNDVGTETFKSSLDMRHLLFAFREVDRVAPPKGCEPVSVTLKGNGKYIFTSSAPPSLEQVAEEYLNTLVVRLQEAWVMSARSGLISASAKVEKHQSDNLQPNLNIGVIGDVANGKSTLVKAISGKRTQCHSSEQQQHGITIRLGFANAAVLECQNAGLCGCYSFLPESEDSEDSDLPVCAKCNHPTNVVRRFSLLDCPGHAELMATMLTGASVFDAVILAGASNLPCPTPQARQHLEAIKMSTSMTNHKQSHIVIAQTKAELLADHSKNTTSRWSPEERIENHAHQGRQNLKDTVAANAPFYPVCSPLGLGLEALAEWIAHLPTVDDTPGTSDAPRMTVLRSFDVNKPGTIAQDMVGGVLGGTLVNSGSISIGDVLEVRPGLCLPARPSKESSEEDKSLKAYEIQPLQFRCTSLMTGKNQLSCVGKGGLIAVGSTLDPLVCADNRMVGYQVGRPGTLPPVWGPRLLLDQLEFVDLVLDIQNSSDQRKGSKPSDRLIKNADIRCHIGSACVKGHLVKLWNRERKVEVHLDGPVCAPKRAVVAIESRKGRGTTFALVAHARLVDGHVCLEGVNGEGSVSIMPNAPDSGDTSDVLNKSAKCSCGTLLESDSYHRKKFLEDLQAYHDRRAGDSEIGGYSKISIPHADISRDGGAHILLSNFGIIAHTLRRDPGHLAAYLEKEGGLTCALAGNRISPATTQLRVKWKGGRNFAERFQSILKKYALAYVTCHQCRGAVTELLGPGKTKQLCRHCNATRFVVKL